MSDDADAPLDDDLTDEATVELDDELIDDELIDDELVDGATDDDDDPFLEDETAVAAATSDDSDDEEADVPVSLDASEDGDDEMDGEPIIDLGAIEGLNEDGTDAEGDDEDDEADSIRDGEFVCSSCHMAKRATALADADLNLCRDCV